MIERIFYNIPPYTNEKIDDNEIVLLNHAKIMIYNIWAIPAKHLNKLLQILMGYKIRLTIPTANQIKQSIWNTSLWAGQKIGWTVDLFNGLINHFIVGYHDGKNTLDDYEKQIEEKRNE